MAYTRTVTLTRPNTGVEIPKVSDSHPDHDVVVRNKYDAAGITKTYTWSGDELTLTVAGETSDKAAMEAVIDELNALPDEAAANTAYKAACQAANVTCVITDSEGTTFASF